MLLSQIKTSDGRIAVVARDGTEAYIVNNVSSVYELALDCAKNHCKIIDRVGQLGLGKAVDLEQLYAEGKLIAPITHPDPAHLHLTGTGLTHLGSASTRDTMHQEAKADTDETLTDTKRMFLMGLEGGKMPNDEIGAQPEWFYKGNGNAVAAPGSALTSPSFAKDGGEEPELAGIYIIAEDGTPFRVGFALGNEFSDHVTEKVNYLYLAHSKLRPASFGPEILLGELPDDIKGRSRILRDGKAIFDEPFVTGEKNMSHSIHNLEHHHFKYDIFRQAGDIHVHLFGTATLSFAKGLVVEDGDMFEISAPDFGLPLRNTHKIIPNDSSNQLMEIKHL